MSRLLVHRGPDSEGEFAHGAFAVGFRRLAILDLAPSGHQPMLSADGRHAIVFNGAIYNYVELREDLAARGHAFRSTGDTEVLLAAYREWGPACLERLNGMWAFLVYDCESRSLFGARDRFGIKPLYMYRDSRSLMFASEVKAIRDSGAAAVSPDWLSIARFLLEDRLDDTERTSYAGICRVEAGSAFEVDATGTMRRWRYWSLPAAQTCAADPPGDYRVRFEEAVRLRMRSDVAVGVQLSGGLDSTSIACVMADHWATAGRNPRDLRAFCYFSPEHDETEHVAATLEQTRFEQVKLEPDPEDLWPTIERHLWHQDEPVHSFTSVVEYKLMSLARSHEVRVLLNGQGADEVLAGYGNYFFDYWSEMLRAARLVQLRNELRAYAGVHGASAGRLGAKVLVKAVKECARGLPGYGALVAVRQRAALRANPWVSSAVKDHWARSPVTLEPGLDAALRYSVEVSKLPLYLRVEDRNAMAHGVEVRLPFLDYRLVEIAFSAGAQRKLHGARTKCLLRDAMQGRIPESVRTATRKFGFPTSIDSWMRGPLYEPLRDLLSSRVVRESGVWNNDAVAAALEQHRSGVRNHAAQLFDVVQLSIWLEGSRSWPAQATHLSR